TAGRGGFRVDTRLARADSLSVEGDLYEEGFSGMLLLNRQAGQSWVNDRLRPGGGHVLGTWTHAFSDTSESTLRIYYDRYHRLDDYIYGDNRRTWDMDFQHRLQIGRRHELLWGVEGRD